MGTVALGSIVLFAALNLPANAQSVPPKWTWPISSDFGPRLLLTNGWDFHEGIDFNPASGDGDLGTPIPNLEDGPVFSIANNRTFLEIVVRGSNTSQKWFYGHIFRNGVTDIGELGSTTRHWELRREAELADPSNPSDRKILNVIIRWDGERAMSAITTIGGEGLWIVGDDGNFIPDVNGGTVTARALVTAGEFIAPMGDALADNVHLHLGLNYPADNPYYQLEHPPDSLPFAVIQRPLDGHLIGASDFTKPFPIKVFLDSKGGLDLDEVSLFIYLNRDANQPHHLGTIGQPTFQYGGRPGENKTTTITASDGNTTGVKPLDADENLAGYQPGFDQFVYLADFKTANNGGAFPDGIHTLVVRCRDINDNPGCGGNSDIAADFTLDTRAPLITVTDVNSQVLSSHSVTSAVGIRIDGNDTFGGVPGAGISSVTLTCEAFADSLGYPASPTGQRPQTASEYFPADLTVLPQGACIAKVKDGAGNESTLEFFIQREPIALFDEFNRSQPLQSEQPLSPATSWSRANTLKFHLAHDDGIRRFTLLRGAGTVQEIVLNEVPEDPEPATIFFVALSSSAAGNKIADSRETYTARLEPLVGEAIERYFVLDRNPPKVDLEEATASPAGSVVIAGAVHDEASGVASVVAIPEANVGPGSGPPDYDGPTYPPGDASRGVGGTFGPGRYFHVARDRSGLAPAVGGSLLGFHVTEEAGYPPAGGGSNYCNRPQPLEYQPFFFGNAGYELKQATMSAGFRFSDPVRQQQHDEGRLTLIENPPNFGEVRLRLRSNDTSRAPFPDLWTVRSFNAPTAEATVMMISKPGLKTMPLAVPLAPDVVARLEVPEDIKSAPATALLKTCDAQGVCTTNSITLGEGEIVPTDITAECTFLTATVEGVDEDVSDTVPAVPTLNARFDLKGVFVEADEITTQGSLTVGRVPFAPPAGHHLEGYVWNINLTAGFQPPLRIGISNQRVWPDYILSKAKCYRVVEGTLAELTCVVGEEAAVAQSPGTSLFFTAVKDGLAPRSSASYAGGSFELPDGSLVISTRTRVTLSASDPAEDGHADSGVTATYLKRDGVFVSTSAPGVELFSGQPFTMAEGAAEFTFASEDFFKNVEAPTTTRVAVDGTPPTATLSLTGPAVFEPSRLIVGPQTFLSFTSTDPVSNGVSAGTAAVAVLLDQTPESCDLSLEETPVVDPNAPPASCANPLYAAPFAVPAGTHTLGYFGVDNVLNAEAPKSTAVVGDYAAPSVDLQTIPQYTNNRLPAFRAAFADPLAGLAVSSLAFTLGGTPLLQTVVTPSTLAWLPGPALLSPIYLHSMVYADGWLYSLGGNGLDTNYHPEVSYSALGDDGAPLGWTATTPLPEGYGVMGAAALGGRIYVVGNWPGSEKVRFSAIGAGGALGAWNLGAALPEPLFSLQAVAVASVGPFLYALGGQGTDNVPRNKVYRSMVDAATGMPATWQEVLPLPLAMTASAAAGWGGRIYVMSGTTPQGLTKHVWSAAVVEGGALDAWRPEPDLPAAVHSGKALAAAGRVYFLGGEAGGRTDKVYSAKVLAGGVLEGWRDESPLHVPLAFHAAAASPDALYYSGGAPGGSGIADTRYMRLNQAEGAVYEAELTAFPQTALEEGTYQLLTRGADRVANAASAPPASMTVDLTPPLLALRVAGSAPQALGPTYFSSLAAGFAASYSDPDGAAPSGIDPASVRLTLDGAAVGIVGGSEITHVPAALSTGPHRLEARVADRAGNAVVAAADVVYDPVPPALALLAPAPGAVYGAGPVALEARLSDGISGLATGSFVLSVGATAYPASAEMLLGGSPLVWDEGPKLRVPVYLNSLVYSAGTLYSLGGNDPSSAFVRDVTYSRVGTDGVPGPWQQTTSLPGDSGSMGAAVLGGRIYLVGNFPGSKRVLYAQTIAQGSQALESEWHVGPELPAALFLAQAVGITAVGPYLYVIGGQALGNAPQKEVYRSRVDPDTGSLLGWQPMRALPEAMTHAAATTLNGRLYVMGGTTDAQSATNPHVWSTAVNGDGTLEEWKAEPDLPTPVRGAQAVSAAGRLYLLAGHNDATGRVAEVWSAAPDTGTLLAGWRAETTLPEPIAFHGAAASPGVLYLAGGVPAGSGTDAVRFARLSGTNPAYSLTASAAGLGEGPHEARASGADLAGNTASASVTFHVDLTAPETSLELLGDFRQVGATTYALPGFALRLSATDYPIGEGGAGVAASYLSTGAAVFALPGELVLEPGFYALTYASVDRVGNFGSTGTAAVKVDAVPPGAPQNLAGAGVSSGTVTFAWAVQGDDDGAGDFADAEVRLDVRTADTGFSISTARVVLSSGPLTAGATLSFAVGGLAPETTYYAAAFARDAAGNWSGPSNVAAAATPFLAQSADAALSLYSGDQTAAVAVVPVAEATGAYTVAIASAFEPVLASFYDLDAEISSGSTARLVFVLEAGYDLNSLAIYTLTETGWTSDSIVNQEVVDLGGGLIQVSGDIFHTSLYAVLVRDTVPPRTAFAPAGNSVLLEDRLFTAAPSSGVLSAVDRAPFGGRPSGVTATLYALDGGPEQAYAGPFALAEGRRNVSFRSVDKQGNAEPGQGAEVFVDASAPILDISLDQPTLPIPEGFATLSATAVLTLSALDPKMDGARAGLAEALYVLDGATTTLRLTPGNAPAGASIPLGTGLHILVWRAEDRLGHVSERRLRIAVGDAQAPALAFRFPRPGEPGLCRLAQGPVAVRATVFDENITSWNLTQGTVLLGSGTANAAGVLGTWDATGQNGPLTLTLAAEDVVANAASLTLDVQAGQPARSLALGGKQVLNKPRGVAAGPNRVYVADTNADAVRVFDAAGTALAVLGGVKGPAKLNKPAGLALDAAGNILVADANNKRVVKLSPAGALLAEYGKGDLQRPVAVALSAGRIVVADAKAGQLLLFSDAGALLVRVDLPPAPGPDEDLEEPRPAALAADAAGNVWVADAKGARILRYGPNLSLAQTIPGFERPEGVAMSPSGTCLAVSDTKAARIRTFDAELSAGLAAFGQHGEIKPFAPLPAEPFLNKPAQLAFTAEGTLLVADRNNDLIQGFGLPGAPAVVALGGRPGKGTRLASADDDGGTVASARVGRFEGGRVEHPDGAAVEIPGGAIAEDLDVAVARAADSGDGHRAREAARGLAGLAAASAAREFSPHGLAFSAPAVITLPYDPLLVAAPRELKIHCWNAERSAWEALASDVDEGARTVSARVAHFSVYQVLGPANTFGALADPEAGFAFRASYAFPNPAVGGQRPTVHVSVGKADKVMVRFYDIAGTPMHEATLDAPSVVNDETGPHWAYEYAWAGHIPSGVYLYAVTAEKAGHAPIRRIGRLAVVR